MVSILLWLLNERQVQEPIFKMVSRRARNVANTEKTSCVQILGIHRFLPFSMTKKLPFHFRAKKMYIHLLVPLTIAFTITVSLQVSN